MGELQGAQHRAAPERDTAQSAEGGSHQAASPADRQGIDPACATPPALHFMAQLMAWKKLASCSPAVT